MALPFDVTFTNPSDPDNPYYVFSGTTYSVPEPSIILLLGASLAGLVGLIGLRKMFEIIG